MLMMQERVVKLIRDLIFILWPVKSIEQQDQNGRQFSAWCGLVLKQNSTDDLERRRIYVSDPPLQLAIAS